ncbi:GntR family transcriptional regulator [Microbacterium sp. SORGH_AS_0888]|uniref:UTRA domain-containing protein n=1 Tax=Microbacterium sp. SORGH_AS_0888 TaxID=3041791 RepID=UPI00277F6798|nr:GntR family transcriptional regulator [Microbacterium sp. SORGH_AS_0888]MDQ1130431.1 GntR family transcriptional regulator [Microbacterium sp. SORGH_AS_0888]
MSGAAGVSRGSVRASSGHSRRAYELVRARIRSGWVPANGVLIENELIHLTGLPRASIRQALNRLADEGLIARQRHSGTRVLGEQYRIPVDDILPSHTPPGFMYRKLSDRVVPMIPLVQAALECDEAEVGVVEQVFEHVTADGAEPVGVRTAYYRPGIHQPESWPTCPSLEFAFRYVFGVALGDVETVIGAVAADDDAAALLHIPVGMPLLVREQRFIDVAGVVQEYSFSHYRADRVSFPLRDRTGRFSGVLAAEPGTPELVAYRERALSVQ